jgi:uncharacterized protein (DUF2225 family)
MKDQERIQWIYGELEKLDKEEKSIIFNGNWNDASYQRAFYQRSAIIEKQIPLVKELGELTKKS